MVGRTDSHCVDGLVINHLAPVSILLGLGIFLVDCLQGLDVYIAKGHDVFR